MWAKQPNWTEGRPRADHGADLDRRRRPRRGDRARRNTELMAGAIPDAGLLLQPEVSHFSMLQDPGAVHCGRAALPPADNGELMVEFDAAILPAVKQPLEIRRTRIERLERGDVLVRIMASGLCHTDLEVIEGSLAYPMPIVLGPRRRGRGRGGGRGRDRREGRATMWSARGTRIAATASIASATSRSCASPSPSPAARPSARRQVAAEPASGRDGASLLGRVVARAVRGRAAVGRDQGAEGDPVRPRLPDRLRRDDGRRRGGAAGAGRGGRLGRGDRLRRGRA